MHLRWLMTPQLAALSLVLVATDPKLIREFNSQLSSMGSLSTVLMTMADGKTPDPGFLASVWPDRAKVAALAKACEGGHFAGVSVDAPGNWAGAPPRVKAEDVCSAATDFEVKALATVKGSLATGEQKELANIEKLVRAQAAPEPTSFTDALLSWNDKAIAKRIATPSYAAAQALLGAPLDVSALEKRVGEQLAAARAETEQAIAARPRLVAGKLDAQSKQSFDSFFADLYRESGPGVKLLGGEKVGGWEMELNNLKQPIGRSQHFSLVVSNKGTPYCFTVLAWNYFDASGGGKFASKGRPNTKSTAVGGRCPGK